MTKISVYCGEDIALSRKDFLEHLEQLQKQGSRVIRLLGIELNLENLENLLGNTNLFGEANVLAIENFLSNQKSKEKEKIIEKILSFPNATLVFWEEKEFSKTEQLKYQGFVFQTYKLPPLVFKFLDGLTPLDYQGNLRRFNSALSSSNENFIFLMLVRQIRLLILSLDNQLASLAPWQAGKIKKQAALFDEKKLVKLYNNLLKIDFKQKTSQSPFNLSSELELLITGI